MAITFQKKEVRAQSAREKLAGPSGHNTRRQPNQRTYSFSWWYLDLSTVKAQTPRVNQQYRRNLPNPHLDNTAPKGWAQPRRYHSKLKPKIFFRSYSPE